MWDCYDAPKASSETLTSLITALKRLVTEKPAILGMVSQMGGIGVQSEPSSASSAVAYGLDMAGRVASATVSGVVGMIGSGGGGLSLQGSAMKLQWSVLPFVQFLALVLTFY
jgi:protein MON2